MSRPLLLYDRNTNLTITKQMFVMIFTQACDKATTTTNTEVGFRVTEMYLFNLSFLLNEAFVPSLVAQNEETPVF
jgi:hypothetical protein